MTDTRFIFFSQTKATIVSLFSLCGRFSVCKMTPVAPFVFFPSFVSVRYRPVLPPFPLSVFFRCIPYVATMFLCASPTVVSKYAVHLNFVIVRLVPHNLAYVAAGLRPGICSPIVLFFLTKCIPLLPPCSSFPPAYPFSFFFFQNFYRSIGIGSLLPARSLGFCSLFWTAPTNNPKTSYLPQTPLPPPFSLFFFSFETSPIYDTSLHDFFFWFGPPLSFKRASL